MPFVGFILAQQSVSEYSPLLAAVLGFIFLAGLTADCALLYEWRQRSKERKPLPMKVERVSWNLPDALLLFAVVTFLLMSLVTITFFVEKERIGNEAQAQKVAQLLGASAQLLIWIGVWIPLFWLRGARVRELFGAPSFPSLGAVTRGLLGFIAVLPPLSALFAIYQWLSRLFPLPNEPQSPILMMRSEADSAMLAWLLIAVIFSAPVIEEIVFRGFIYPAVKKHFGTTVALLSVAFLFALMHWHLPSFVPLFFLGVSLALAYELTGTLWTSIVLHMAFNAFSSWVTLQAKSGGAL